MNPNVIAAMAEREIITVEECPRDNEPAMDGTGEHLGLRTPWYNDLSHTITDSTIFRLLLIAMVVDYVLKLLK